MTTYQTMIKKEFFKVKDEVSALPVFQKLRSGKLTVEHYKGVLRQIYLQTRDNPQVQAAVTMRLKAEQRQIIKKFIGHALSEVGHDQLAVNDLVALGEDVSDLPNYRPLPGTSAMKAFAFHMAHSDNPAAYFGYLYQLEAMAIESGPGYIAILKALGIPDSALSFIHEHAKFDVAHMKLNEEYISYIVQSDEDFEAFCYGMRTSAVLYSRMIEDAFNAADQNIKTHSMTQSECSRFDEEKVLKTA